MDCDVLHWLGGEQQTIYKRVETFHTFQNFERKSERESPRRTISASGGSGSLHGLCLSPNVVVIEIHICVYGGRAIARLIEVEVGATEAYLCRVCPLKEEK